MTDPAQRLACGHILRRMPGARRRMPSDGRGGRQKEIREARRSLFGFTLPKIPSFSGYFTADEAQRQLDTTITSVRP